MKPHKLSFKKPSTYALKVNSDTGRVYLYDGHRQLFSFDSRIEPAPETIADWPTVGYTENMGPWRKGEYTTVQGWHLFLADPYLGPCIALRQ
jgi:hypothetical protein